MKTDVFHLQIIPVEDILPQEVFDGSRVRPLSAEIKKEGRLVNPIIVAPFEKRKYLQLDGMNRFSAFKILGLNSILVQIIDYNDQESVELSSWTHFFSSDKDKFIDFVTKNHQIAVKQGKADLVGHRYIKEEGSGRLCTLCSKDGTVYTFSSDGNLADKIDRLNGIVSFYENTIVRDVLPVHPNEGDINLLFEEHPEKNLMLVFPTFTRHQIIDVVRSGKLFPAGVTRHIIRRRCLNVNVPLSLFDNHKTVEDQNTELEKMLSEKSFRLYEEPTVYFE